MKNKQKLICEEMGEIAKVLSRLLNNKGKRELALIYLDKISELCLSEYRKEYKFTSVDYAVLEEYFEDQARCALMDTPLIPAIFTKDDISKYLKSCISTAINDLVLYEPVAIKTKTDWENIKPEDLFIGDHHVFDNRKVDLPALRDMANSVMAYNAESQILERAIRDIEDLRIKKQSLQQDHPTPTPETQEAQTEDQDHAVPKDVHGNSKDHHQEKPSGDGEEDTGNNQNGNPPSRKDLDEDSEGVVV